MMLPKNSAGVLRFSSTAASRRGVAPLDAYTGHCTYKCSDGSQYCVSATSYGSEMDAMMSAYQSCSCGSDYMESLDCATGGCPAPSP